MLLQAPISHPSAILQQSLSKGWYVSIRGLRKWKHTSWNDAIQEVRGIEMVPSLQRSSPPLHNGESQAAQAWVANLQMALLSDTDAGHIAAMLEHTKALANSWEGTNTSEKERRRLPCTLRVGARLDRGITRKSRPNEDSLFIACGVLHSLCTPPALFGLFIVADGMGGHEHGQEAGQIAVQSLVEYVCTSLRSIAMQPEVFLPFLAEGVRYANREVYRQNQECNGDMGTTLTAALVIGSTAYIAHVGDSRAYLHHKPAGLSQITHDHSIAAALAEAGVIRPEDIFTHPRRNVIYRCLGHKSTVEVDTCVVPLTDGDMLLLCSDGLWEMVRDQQIASIVTTPPSDATQRADMLVQAALAGGGEDNVSTIIVQWQKS
jgi:serine/threonine protein phosphatase PrpC